MRTRERLAARGIPQPRPRARAYTARTVAHERQWPYTYTYIAAHIAAHGSARGRVKKEHGRPARKRAESRSRIITSAPYTYIYIQDATGIFARASRAKETRRRRYRSQLFYQRRAFSPTPLAPLEFPYVHLKFLIWHAVATDTNIYFFFNLNVNRYAYC